MTDKYRELREALNGIRPRGASPELCRELLADHDRMREALQYIATLDSGLMSGTPDPIGSLTEASETAREALQECGR